MLNYLAQVGKSWVVTPTTEKAARDNPDNLNMLLIGNSYTGFNNLDQLVQEALLAGGGDATATTTTVHVERHTPPGETFAGHWKGIDQGHTFRRLSFDYYYRSTHLQKWLLPSSNTNSKARRQDWKWIALQNHSVQAGFCRSPDGSPQKAIFDESLESLVKIHGVISEHHPRAKTMLVLTWGRPGPDSNNLELYPDYSTMQSCLLEGYGKYVQATSTPRRPTYLVPVGLVFRTIYQDCVAAGIADPTKCHSKSLFYELYDKGDHHPSLAGSYIYALTMYATMTGRDVTQTLSEWVPGSLDKDVAKTLREAVQRTIQETVNDKTIRYPWQEE